MAPTSRIRWTQDEKDLIVSKAASIRSNYPTLTLRRLAELAQDVVPETRRRALHPALVQWVGSEVKRRAGENARVGATEASTRRATFETLGDPVPADDAPRGAEQEVRSESLVGKPSALVQLAVAAGVDLVVGILGNPRVRIALQELMRASLVSESLTGNATDSEGSADGSRNMHSARSVLIVGANTQMARELKSSYRDVLMLSFADANMPGHEIDRLISSADIVVGIESELSAAMTSSINRRAKNYVRQSGNISGLRVLLAELATTSSPK